MSDVPSALPRDAAAADFNARSHRDDGDKVVSSLNTGLSALRDAFFNRIHCDVEKAFGMDSMLIPIASMRTESSANMEIEIYENVEVAASVREAKYLPDDTWFLDWLTRLRIANDATNPAVVRRLATYSSQTPNDRRRAFSTRLPQLFPEAGQAPLVIFRLFPLAISAATAIAFGDTPRAEELRKQQVNWLPSIADCHACHGRLMDNGEACPQCGNPLWKFAWLTAG